MLGDADLTEVFQQLLCPRKICESLVKITSASFRTRQLTQLIRACKAGQQVQLDLKRGEGTVLTLSFPLGERPAAAPPAQPEKPKVLRKY